MPTYVIYIIDLLISLCVFGAGIYLGKIIFSPKGRDGTLRVKKTSDDELMTLFELDVKPGDLLEKDIFVLRIEHIE